MTKKKTTRQGDASISYRPTVIEFILDETGSMQSYKSATIAGYNTFINEQREQAGQCLLSLTKFDTTGMKTPFVDLDLSMVVPMTNDTFNPGSGTNLRDTIADRVNALRHRLSTWSQQPNVLVIVMTDGQDNASHAYSEPQIKDMIKASEAEGWTFVFLGAYAGALQTAQRLGFQPGNTKQFEGVHMEETLTQLSNATTAYRSVRAGSEAFASTNYFAG